MPARSSATSKVARKPVQNRSRERVQKIIDAAEAIINEEGWGAASSHAIAKRAGVPPAGVYHFFPDRYMIFDAIIERNTLEFNEKFDSYCDQHTVESWQDVIRLLIQAMTDYVSADRCARELSFGCDGEYQTRWADSVRDMELASTVEQVFTRYFEKPDAPHLDRKFLMASDFIMTGFTQAVKHGDPMDHAILEEMTDAVLAYMATWVGQPKRIN